MLFHPTETMEEEDKDWEGIEFSEMQIRQLIKRVEQSREKKGVKGDILQEISDEAVLTVTATGELEDIGSKRVYGISTVN